MLGGGGDLAITAMKTFGTYSSLALSITVAGALCGSLVNYLLGAIFYKIYSKYAKATAQERHKEFSLFFSKCAPLILLLSFFLGAQSFATYLSGFARLGILPFVVYSVLSSAIYYMLI